MKYKALMLDVDGTLIPYDYEAVPSKRLVNAIKKIQNRVTVCLVTGRSFGFTETIIATLGITQGFVVVNNGAQVIDLKTRELVYGQMLTLSDAQYICDVLFQEKIKFHIKQEVYGLDYIKSPFTKKDILKSPYSFYTPHTYTSEQIDHVLKKLSVLTNITTYKGHHKDPHKFGLTISHVNATKLHGVVTVIEKLNIKKEEVIGIGDGYNDFPLLMASGLKVAMGNAVEDLKAIADYVAPTVEEDGVVDVIEKFILKK